MPFHLAKYYTREEIHGVLGGSKEEYLPTKGGRVVCGAFRRDANPDAPLIVLPGFGPKIEKSAKIFTLQSWGVPIFLKRDSKQWQYVGDFRVKRISVDPHEVERHSKRAHRENGVSIVLFLERLPE